MSRDYLFSILYPFQPVFFGTRSLLDKGVSMPIWASLLSSEFKKLLVVGMVSEAIEGMYRCTALMRIFWDTVC